MKNRVSGLFDWRQGWRDPGSEGNQSTGIVAFQPWQIPLGALWASLE